ncbi:uncharacterized protein C8orf74-like [Montipora foliosa]|uniref:uncharacterized protein C8orf74-like n=1 Tax=Montipora foliosa TaxID=591990 RepID=UPI0035F1E2D5
MALHERGLQGLQDVFRNSDVTERKKMLARLLKFPDFDEEDDLKTAILLDVYYEMLCYSINRGFLWPEVSSFFEVFKRLLSKAEGKSVVEAVLMFKDELSCNKNHFRQSSLKSIVDYMFLTVFQHYKLYQFVLTQERTKETTELNYTIEPPLRTLTMRHALPKSLWDVQQKLKQIDQMEHQRSQERTAQFEEEMQHAMHHLNEQLDKLESFPSEHLTKDNLVAFVSNVTAGKAAVTSVSLGQKIHELHDSLEFRFHRTNIGEEVNKEEKKSATPVRRSIVKSGKK